MIPWLILLVLLFGSVGAGVFTSWLLVVATGRKWWWYLLPVFVGAWAVGGVVLLATATAFIGRQVK